MQYTLRNVPPQLDEALRARAREEGKSLNEVTIEALLAGVGLTGQPAKHRDLSDIVGNWVADPATDEILQEQRRIRNRQAPSICLFVSTDPNLGGEAELFKDKE